MGWGLYYKFLLGFIIVNAFSHGMACLSIYFAVPMSSCDIILSKDNIITVHICFTLGKAIGGFILNSISDNTGKKCMIPKSLLIIFASTFVAAFSHSAYTIYLAAVTLGTGLQANIVSTKVYLAEILPTNSRGFYLVFTDVFWTVGYFITATFSYFMNSTNLNVAEHQHLDMRLTSWRIIFAVSGGVAITMACAAALVETSPRYLLFKRRLVSAALVLKHFYAINKSKYSETFELHSQQLFGLITDYDVNIEPEPVGMAQNVVVTVTVMFRMIFRLMRRKFLKKMIILVVVHLPLMLGTASTTILLSQVVFANTTHINGTTLLYFVNITEKQCTIAMDKYVFGNFLLVSANVLLGQIILLFIIDRIGRKIPICVCLTLCGLSSVILAFNENVIMGAVAASLFTLAFSMADSALFVVYIESFPTALRGTAIGQIFFYSAVLTSVTYKFLAVHSQILFIIYGAITLGCAIVAYFIQDLKKRPMIE